MKGRINHTIKIHLLSCKITSAKTYKNGKGNICGTNVDSNYNWIEDLTGFVKVFKKEPSRCCKKCVAKFRGLQLEIKQLKNN